MQIPCRNNLHTNYYIEIITPLYISVNDFGVKKMAIFKKEAIENQRNFLDILTNILNSKEFKLKEMLNCIQYYCKIIDKVRKNRYSYIIWKGVEQMQLEECVNYLLTTAQHSVFLKMTEKLSVFEITPVQYAVLYCLWEKDKKSPKEIAERLKLENSTISGILERMEKKGLIERSISKEDRRFIQVLLTPKGASLEEEVLAAVEEVNSEVLSIFSDEESEVLKARLRLLAGIEA